jgi:hypothetical protein
LVEALSNPFDVAVVTLPAVGILSSLESPAWILEAPGLDHVRKVETRMKVTDIGNNGQHSVVGNGLSRNLLDRTTRGGYQLNKRCQYYVILLARD